MNHFFLTFLLIIAIPFTFFQAIMGGLPPIGHIIISVILFKEINQFITRIRPLMPEWILDPVPYFERELNFFGSS